MITRPWVLAFLLLMPLNETSAQGDCFGLRRAGCEGSWVSQIGYHRRIDGQGGGLNRVTWQYGPQAYLPRHGVGLGGSVITVFDDDGETQFGLNVRGFRARTLGLHLGVAIFFVDSRSSTGQLALSANAAVSFFDHVQIAATLEAFERTPQSTQSRVYLGTRLLKFNQSMYLPSLLVTFGAFIAATIVNHAG